jgi:hypothetical protein
MLTRCSEFFTPELRDLVSHDYELKGNKRLRSQRNLPDNDWILSKIGTGQSSPGSTVSKLPWICNAFMCSSKAEKIKAIIKRTSSIRGMSCDGMWEVRNI